MVSPQTRFLQTASGKIAYRQGTGGSRRVGLMWLGGFHSNMTGEKATALHEAAAAARRAFVRFDYSGHGESEGRFEEGTISVWRENALEVLDRLTEGPQVLVGSSMGGWIALLCALARPERVQGLILLAPAPDFTEKLMWARFGEAEKRQIQEKGFWTRPSAYDVEGYPITRALIEDGARWSILDQPISFDGPVRIFHGALDADVPSEHSRRLVEALTSQDISWTLVKDGDHRLSREQDIQRMSRETLALADQLEDRSASRHAKSPSR